jgi:hypothetical protein
MTLKEKFTKILYTQSHDDTECLRIRFENIEKVIYSQEKIADDYAIKFAEWCMLNYNFINKEHYTILLKEFKKQKGL